AVPREQHDKFSRSVGNNRHYFYPHSSAARESLKKLSPLLNTAWARRFLPRKNGESRVFRELFNVHNVIGIYIEEET
ncbi:hypothetical protein, partial [uncultured Gimesia sp.]|uniref:hypothetical protein n=1 Tax=uncultured Gimesia sp. TaxID=1678688 RepID=UPI00260A5B47